MPNFPVEMEKQEKRKKKRKKDEGNRRFDSHFLRFLFFLSDNNFFLPRDKNDIFINIYESKVDKELENFLISLIYFF